jgi:class 3 adenylate cyclase
MGLNSFDRMLFAETIAWWPPLDGQAGGGRGMIEIDSSTPCPLPEDPVLRVHAQALEDSGNFGCLVDDRWRLVFMTEEFRRAWGNRDGSELAPLILGVHFFSPEATAMIPRHRFGFRVPDLWRLMFGRMGGMVLADTPGGREALRAEIDPVLHDLVDDLDPIPDAAFAHRALATGPVGDSEGAFLLTRLRDEAGTLRGTQFIGKPAAGMSALAGVAFGWDPRVLDRIEKITRAKRHPAALLFADLEGSSTLSASLPSATYFALARRLIRAADRGVVEAGGIVGRHVGDGVVAFFPVETLGSASTAVRACIEAARALRGAVDGVAARSGLTKDDVVIRFGLHWGSTLYMGRISTVARTEVTALGDEVNEAARIEACASGGRMLASKVLVERLDGEDADALGLDPDALTYTRLRDLTTATDKARRDAPAIAVCEI